MRGSAEYRAAEQALFDHLGWHPVERTLRLPRHRVKIRGFESGEGPPVLFLHGATNSGASWAALAGALSGRRCIVLDRPGCGLSEPLEVAPGVEGLPEHGDTFVVDVLDALEVERADLVSTSYGGYLALRAAAAHPDRIGRIVHLGWTLGAPTGRLPAIMRLAGAPGMARLMGSMPVNERAVRSMFRQIGLGRALAEGRIDQHVIDCYVALLRHTDTMRNELTLGGGRSLPALVAALELPDDVLARIDSPTLLLWGDEDPFGPPDIAVAFTQRLPHAQLELLPKMGHAPWLDDLDHVAEATAAWLSA